MCMNSAPYDGQQKGLALYLPRIILSLLNSPVTGMFSFLPKKILYAKLYDIWMNTKESYCDLFTTHFKACLFIVWMITLSWQSSGTLGGLEIEMKQIKQANFALFIVHMVWSANYAKTNQ